MAHTLTISNRAAEDAVSSDPFDFDPFRKFRQLSDYFKANPAFEAMQRMTEHYRLEQGYQSAMDTTRLMHEQLLPPTIRNAYDALAEQTRRHEELFKSIGPALPDSLFNLAQQYAETFQRSQFLSALSQATRLDEFVASQT